MDRRSFVGSTAVASLAALPAAAMAAGKESHQHHHGKSVARAVPASKSGANPFAPLMISAAECLTTAEVCLAHCLRQMEAGDTSMAQCAQAVSQMLALCRALHSLAAQQSSLTAAQANVAIEGCKLCAEACKPHAAHHAECKACHDACLRCLEACKKVVY